MEVAKWVASLEGTAVHQPVFGQGAPLLMTAGLLWMVLWQTPLRWLGFLPLGGIGSRICGSARSRCRPAGALACL